jgi:2-alkyl-3-oxoalkanoate reductase
MRVLITGASGFFGGHLAEAFRHAGHAVVAFVRPSSATTLLRACGTEIQTGELTDLRALRTAAAGANVVVHAAARVDPFGRWSEFVQTTIAGTRHVLAAAGAEHVPQFIHISSRGIYERPKRADQPYDETCDYGTPYRWSYYARAKIEAEQVVREAQQRQLIQTTIVRPSWIYGPRDRVIFPRIVTALRRRRLIWIGDGENLLNLIYVSDAVKAVLRVAGNPAAHGQIFNVSADELSVSQRVFITTICDLLALPIPVSRLSYPVAHRLGFLGECVAHATGFRVRPPLTRLSVLLLGGRRRFLNDQLKSRLGWQPVVPFAEGIRETVAGLTA